MKSIFVPADSLYGIWAALLATTAEQKVLYSTSETTVPLPSFQPNDPRVNMTIKLLGSSSLPSSLSSSSTPISQVLDETRNVTDAVDTASSTTMSTDAMIGTPERPLIIVNWLSGEMGNNLGKFAAAYGIQRWLEDDYNITSTILDRHQEHAKWVKGRNDIKRCFPNLADYDFGAANTNDYLEREQQQKDWLGEDADRLIITDPNFGFVEKLDFLKNVLATRTDAPAVPPDSNYTMPFLVSSSFPQYSRIADRYFEEIKDLLTYDTSNPECCFEFAEPDEVVFHLRNFLNEMPRRGKKLGFEELSPNKTANELFKEAQPGTKVIVINRFTEKEAAPYLDAMRDAGLEPRMSKNTNPNQDFCLAMSAKTVTGTARSTFFGFAAYLGNATKAHAYSVKSPATVARFGDDLFDQYDFENPILRDRFSFELYNSEEQDLVDANRSALLRRFR